ncbi:MAG TPA: 5-aminolevulinate synthase [Phnomibacter sp.]|nr:5-aminolevulinate synthase [Phnomibacter sp.]
MFPFNQYFRQEVERKKRNGEYRYFLEIERDTRLKPYIQYRTADGISGTAVNWCSNDYLGLSQQEAVIGAALETLSRSGVGSGGTRNLSGTSVHHRMLEKLIADWHQKEAALVFNSAYLANYTTIEAIGRSIPDLILISDERNHASMIEGIRSTHCRKVIFRHNDTDHLEVILASLPKDQPKMVLFESVYSINGSVAPVKDILKLCRRYKALSYVDEVHAVGLYGGQGEGMLASKGCQHKADIINGTMAKAVGSLGGYIAASSHIVDFVRSFGKPFIFSTSLPPAICSAAFHAIKTIRQDQQLRNRFFENVQKLRSSLGHAAIPFHPNRSHITTIPVGDAHKVRAIAEQLLLDDGIYIQPVNAPTVRTGEECLRIIITPAHSEDNIHDLVNALSPHFGHKVVSKKNQMTPIALET